MSVVDPKGRPLQLLFLRIAALLVVGDILGGRVEYIPSRRFHSPRS